MNAREMTPEQVADFIADAVNCGSIGTADQFAKAMRGQHRTLQQGFTRACIAWLDELRAMGEDGAFDLRNEASVQFAMGIADHLSEVVVRANRGDDHKVIAIPFI